MSEISSPIKLNILTLALNLPGPLAVSRLQKLGAKVIKIEPPTGDPLKKYSPEWYRELTAGQDVATLNLKEAKQREELDKFLQTSDLLITSMRPQTLKKLGLEAINSKFPDLSHIEIIGYPDEKENFAGHDLTYQAGLGLLNPPALPKTLWADLIAADKVFSTALLQVVLKQHNQPAQHQQISIVESLSSFLLPLKYGLTSQGDLLGGGFAGYNLYQTSDGWIALAALETHFWNDLLKNLNLENADINSLQEIFLTKKSRYWSEWARELNLPLTEVIL